MAKIPVISQYDYFLGIDSDILDYIQESHEVQSRISSTPCYLFYQSHSGSAQGSFAEPLVITSFISEDSNGYRAVIWPSGSLLHPDLRPYTNDGKGSFDLYIDGIAATRVIEPEDIISETEFALVERRDLPDQRIEAAFHPNFDPALHTVSYFYSSMLPGIESETMKRGDHTDHSIFGWTQYISEDGDAFRRKNQVLVRFPMITGDVQINEEGKVTLEENLSWMTADPLVNDFDMLVITAERSPFGVEKRMEIVNKQDSIIQGRLVSQRFNVKLLEESDPRYKIPVVTT